MLIKTIEDYHLNDYTLIALNNDNIDNIDKEELSITYSDTVKNDDIVNDESEVTYHEVRKKDNLYSISVKYKTTVSDLKKWNNLNSNDLYIGQKLIVSKE